MKRVSVRTTDVVTVEETTPAREIAHLMSEHHFKRVPVVKDAKVVGMLGSGGFDGGDRLSIVPSSITISQKTLISCQNGGMQTRRDLPRFVRLIEDGHFDVKSMIKVYRFEDVMQALQDVVDRTVVGAVVKFG